MIEFRPDNVTTVDTTNSHNVTWGRPRSGRGRWRRCWERYRHRSQRSSAQPVILSRLLVAILAVLLWIIPVHAQTFTRGTWTQYGTGTYDGVLFRGDGTAPYDHFADGTTSVKGVTMQQAEGGTGGSDALLGAYSTGGLYIQSLDAFLALCTTGHGSGGSNEVNQFALSSGTWVNVVRPTVRLYMPVNETWSSSIAYRGIGLTVPLGLVDIGNDYAANIAPSQNGAQIVPVNRQIYGGIADMPTVHKVFLFGGFGYWNAPNGAASIGATYDYVTHQYQFLDAERWPAGSPNNVTTATWDPDQQRVLFTTELHLYAYYPGRTQGSRVVQIVNGDGCGSDGCSQYTMLYDTKRHRAVLFGGGTPRYYDFSSSPMRPTVVPYRITGDGLITNVGPGMLYDPVGDQYVHFPGGRTLVYINPDTFVGASKTTTNPSSATPTTPNMGGGGGPGTGMWYRFFYWPSKDAYVALVHAKDTGVYVFAPIRSPAP